MGYMWTYWGPFATVGEFLLQTWVVRTDLIPTNGRHKPTPPRHFHAVENAELATRVPMAFAGKSEYLGEPRYLVGYLVGYFQFCGLYELHKSTYAQLCVDVFSPHVTNVHDILGQAKSHCWLYIPLYFVISTLDPMSPVFRPLLPSYQVYQVLVASSYPRTDLGYINLLLVKATILPRFSPKITIWARENNAKKEWPRKYILLVHIQKS